MNLIEQLDGVIQDLDKLCIANKNLAPKAQEKLSSAKELLMNAYGVLYEVNENIIALVETDGASIQKTSSLLGGANNGVISGEDLTSIVEESSLVLNMLFRGRIDITSIFKFSAEEISAAKELGQSFRQYERYWAQLRYRLTMKLKPLLVVVPRGEISKTAGLKNTIAPKMEPFLFCDQLTKHKIIASATPQLAKKLPFKQELSKALEDDSLWADYEKEWRGYTNPNFIYNGPTRILLKDIQSPEMAEFVMGSWFEAFVEYLFKDQLRRLKKPYEVFTQVKYTTDLVGQGIFKGELDVIVATEDKIVIVECKSGVLRKEESDRILQRKSVIMEALSIAHEQDRQVDFILVHAPRDPESQDIIDELATNGVQAFDPQGVIGFIREHF